MKYPQLSMGDPNKRVKVYALNADKQWIDEGTGHIKYSIVNNQYSLTVYSENDNSVLLDTKINSNIAYQRQQDTLIVWCENEDVELALSFQEKEGRDTIWELISHVQRQHPHGLITAKHVIENSDDDDDYVDALDEMEEQSSTLNLPTCEASNLQEISTLLDRFSTHHDEEKISKALLKCNYVNELVNAFCLCEERRDVKNIEHLQDIFKRIICLNRSDLLDDVFKDDIVFDVVGCLEYNPLSIEPTKNREFLKNSVHYKEVVPIKNTELLKRIHLTFRVQFIHDVVLAPKSLAATPVEENVLSCLSSFLYVNKRKIVSLINDDKPFLKEVFGVLINNNTDLEKCRTVILFLKELCCYSHCLGVLARESFFINLFSLKIFRCLASAMMRDDALLKCTALDVLNSIIECFPSTARHYILLETNISSSSISLTSVLIQEILNGSDSHLFVNLLKILLNPETIEPAVERADRINFLNYFFKNDMPLIIEFLLENALNASQLSKFSVAHILEDVLDFLMYCIQNHSDHIKDLFIQKDLLRHVLLLMESSHTFLALSAIRLMRRIIALKDVLYNEYIIAGKLFTPIVEAFLKNQGRYNLLDSAILELFEFIRREEMKDLCSHVIKAHGNTLNGVEYVRTFQLLASEYPEETTDGEEQSSLCFPHLKKSIRRSLMQDWRRLNLQSSDEAASDSDQACNADDGLEELNIEPEMNEDSTEGNVTVALATVSKSSPDTFMKFSAKNSESISSKKRQLVDYASDSESSSDNDDCDDDEVDDLALPQKRFRVK